MSKPETEVTVEKSGGSVNRQQILEVQNYIENHLEEDLTAERLATQINFSEFYFQHLFRKHTGESLHEFIKRLRLEKAFFLLRGSRKKAISDIAMDVGFYTQASFAKAFKEYYKITPSCARHMSKEDIMIFLDEKSRNGKVFESNSLYNGPVEIRIEHKGPIKMVYKRSVGAYKGDEQLFEECFRVLQRCVQDLKLKTEDLQWYTVFHDYDGITEESKVRISMGFEIKGGEKTFSENLDKTTFGILHIPEGTYAIGTFLLGTDEYQAAWNYMLENWLPESKYDMKDRPCFEHYLHKETQEQSEKQWVEIGVPIVPI